MSSAIRRFGILECIVCGVDHEFVSYSPQIKHITDAFCCECGFSYGRRDDVDLGTPPIEGQPGEPFIRQERHKVAVIDDATAARALARLQAVAPGKADGGAVTHLRMQQEAAKVAAARAVERPTPPPDEPPPERRPEVADLLDVEDDGSRRADFLRSLRTWQNQSNP